MELKELQDIVKAAGIVGAGGAGFPSYGKLDSRTKTVVLNCAECEPLLTLHKQLLRDRTHEILRGLELIRETVGAKECIIAVKKSYRETADALNSELPEFPYMRMHVLPEAYPMGDEVVLLYETTGKVIRPGGLPIQEGAAVFNVETVYNLYRAVYEKAPVISKYVTVSGAVAHPITVRVPVGMLVSDVISLAGGILCEDPEYILGGPMMGRIGSLRDPVTKTTSSVLVLPKDHPVVRNKHRNPGVDISRAAASCCQCRTCTDLCPRHLLGHPIEPHKFMRAVSSGRITDTTALVNTMFCCSCGVCELYACPQGLSPRSLIAAYKTGLREAGLKAPADPVVFPVSQARGYRRVPEERLLPRLGLLPYEHDAPEDHTVRRVSQVKLMLSQHIGAPAVSVVKEGDPVHTGDLVARAAEGLSCPVHASIDGTVKEVTERYILIGD